MGRYELAKGIKPEPDPPWWKWSQSLFPVPVGHFSFSIERVRTCDFCGRYETFIKMAVIQGKKREWTFCMEHYKCEEDIVAMNEIVKNG